MELSSLIKTMSNEDIILDEQEVQIKDVLKESKFDILKSYLKEKKLITTNDIKKLNLTDFNKLKMTIPGLEGVGIERTDLFIKTLDMLRKEKYLVEEKVFPLVENYGKIKISPNWFIEINNIKYNEKDEYIDIRQIKNDGTRGKGLSVKKQYFTEFKNLINKINIDEEPSSVITETTIGEKTINKQIKNDDSQIEILDENEKTLKELILENENIIYNNCKNEFGLSIKQFITKIEKLREDGDVIRFLENKSIMEIKKEQYDFIHKKGLKTAIDIKNEYSKTDIKYTSINDLKTKELINGIMISSIANNFNNMLGMYYDEINKILILKSQIKDGPYEDKWIENNKKLHYCLQSENLENYSKLNFSKQPNKICKNIIFGYDLDTKVYLFYRYNKGEDYIFAGEVELEKFTDGNKAVILTIKDN